MAPAERFAGRVGVEPLDSCAPGQLAAPGERLSGSGQAASATTRPARRTSIAAEGRVEHVHPQLRGPAGRRFARDDGGGARLGSAARAWTISTISAAPCPG